jgi:predicted PurR-regulated permease PerM
MGGPTATAPRPGAEATALVEPEPSRVQIELSQRQRRLLDAFLLLGTIALAFLVIGLLDNAFRAFQDIIILFFLAWLMSFALLPIINLVAKVMPRAPRWLPVILVYGGLVILFVGLLIQLAASLADSIGDLIANAPTLEVQLRGLLAEVEGRARAIGYNVDLQSQAPAIIATLNRFAQEAVGPIQQFAIASLGALGNLLLILFLSLYIALDRAPIVAFLFRLVPPGFVAEARLLQTSVAKSFGGFIRGQVLQGVLFGVFAAAVNIVVGLPYGAATAVVSGVLHAIPFFGPFASWAPPVVVAVLDQPDKIVPALILMGIGWFVSMNILGPRLMGDTVGIHPIVVLASVLIGAKIAGIMGAIFGVPIAAVISAFFYHFYRRSRESGTVADRAAQRLAAREGRDIRRPREPVAGIDEDVGDSGALTAPSADAAARATGAPSGPGTDALPASSTPGLEGERG